MLDDVLRDEREPLVRSDHGLELRPLALELLLALDLLPLGRLLEVRIDPRALGIVQGELGKPALVVDRHRGAVLHRALDVVDADVIAEHGAGVGVRQLNRRAGEADERGIRQRVAHVPRKAVDEVVLAAVRLVGHHHDVAPVGERGVAVAFLLGEELVDGGEHHAAGGHRQQLAQMGAALGPQRLAHRHLHRVKLVVARHLLDEAPAAVVLEHEEVADEIEKSARREDPIDHHLHRGQVRVGQPVAGDRAPRLEPLPSGAERADPRLHAVGGDEHGVGRKEQRDLHLVGLELLECGPDGCVLGGGVLQLQHPQRQAVDEQHHVRPAGVLVLRDRELVDCEPVVARGIVEVDHPRLGAADVAVRGAILDRHAVHEQAVHRAVAGDHLNALGPRELAEGIFERLG